MAGPRDARDKRTDLVSRFIDAALADTDKAATIAELVLPDDAAPVLPNWPQPNVEANHLARLDVCRAVPYIERAAARLGLKSLSSSSPGLPEPRLEIAGTTPASVLFRAPLVIECLEGRAGLELAVLLAYFFSRHLRHYTRDDGSVVDLFAAPDVQLNLMERLNGYLLLERNLWWLAREGGFPDPVPYSVRYETARWLWSPKIAGVVFCLRCGGDLIYRRVGRGDRLRQARCAPCSRGKDVSAWPHHAVAPHDRGRWWLRCRTKGCSNIFVANAQARLCPSHQTARLSRRRRGSNQQASIADRSHLSDPP